MSKVALEIKSLSKSFGDFKAVDDLSIDVMQGEIFSLLGPNGAGKTTTIHMISGMLAMDEGTIRFNSTSHHQGLSSTHKIGVCTQHDIVVFFINPLIFFPVHALLGSRPHTIR